VLSARACVGVCGRGAPIADLSFTKFIIIFSDERKLCLIDTNAHTTSLFVIIYIFHLNFKIYNENYMTWTSSHDLDVFINDKENVSHLCGSSSL